MHEEKTSDRHRYSTRSWWWLKQLFLYLQVEAKHEEKMSDGHSYSTRSWWWLKQLFLYPSGGGEAQRKDV